ncbi:pantetheine-phosphate adenylyltransferase [Kaustia mangrovi]|uniref:Phosphopantetheine adenylyltransferase n=1 Tax=Kaustia mangrovi TaxID=2593653 RepID=A0A7S8HAJ6_9HYPH|nr:pantetheine-phosphate adenylyltransferase [Kaustia mangrovi]QPC41652.1 pantetheine-phosphate adenylyltransferase [Kaustia mangrovi]
MRTGFYPGSFDPVTNGHIDVIARAARLVDRLVLGVGVHHGKTALLPASDRVALLEEVCVPLGQTAGCDIEVATFDTLAVEAARSQGAHVMVRGLRDASDFDYEVQMAQMNAAMAGDVETIFLAASPDTRMIASSLVKQIARMGGDISPFVPDIVRRRIDAALDRA